MIFITSQSSFRHRQRLLHDVNVFMHEEKDATFIQVWLNLLSHSVSVQSLKSYTCPFERFKEMVSMESGGWMNSEWRANGFWTKNRIWWALSERRMERINRAQTKAQCEQRVIAECKMNNLLGVFIDCFIYLMYKSTGNSRWLEIRYLKVLDRSKWVSSPDFFHYTSKQIYTWFLWDLTIHASLVNKRYRK